MSLLNALRRKPGVYMITRPDRRTRTGQRVEYVGRSKNIDKRLDQHERTGRLDPVKDRVFTIRERNLERQKDIEATLIRDFAPARNRRVEPVCENHFDVNLKLPRSWRKCR